MDERVSKRKKGRTREKERECERERAALLVGMINRFATELCCQSPVNTHA